MLEDAKFEIDCPNCNKSFYVCVEEVGTTVICPHCNSNIKLLDDDFTEKISNAEDSINQFLDNLSE